MWLVRLEGIAVRAPLFVAVDIDLLCRYSGANADARFPSEDYDDEYVVNNIIVTRRTPISADATFHPGFCFHPPVDNDWSVPGPALLARAALADMTGDADPYEGAYLDTVALWILVENHMVTELLDASYLCAG